MTHQEGPHQGDRLEDKDLRKDRLEEDFLGEEYRQEVEDFQEEGHPQDPLEEDILMEDPEQEAHNLQTSWWETHLKYSREYERKLSLSLLFGGSMQALTGNALSLPTHTRRAFSSSCTFRGMMWPNGYNQ